MLTSIRKTLTKLTAPKPIAKPAAEDEHDHVNELNEECKNCALDIDDDIDSDEEGVFNEPDDDGDKTMAPTSNGYQIKYVPMPDTTRKVLLGMQSSPNLQGEVRKIGSKMKAWIELMSRNKVTVTIQVGPEKPLKGKDSMRLVLRPGAHSHVPIIGNSITAKHELMHQFGMGHANIRIWETQIKEKQSQSSRDPFDVLTVTPGQKSLNAAHLHRLGWFSDTEVAYAEDGGEYVLRVINDGNSDFKSLKAIYYKVPGTNREYWFSYVVVQSKGWKAPAGMPGTAVAVHNGIMGSTFLEGLTGLVPKTHVRSGLILELSKPTAKTVNVKVKLDPTWVVEEPKPKQK